MKQFDPDIGKNTQWKKGDERARAAGIASGVAKRQKKSIKANLEMLMAQQYTLSEKDRKLLQKVGLDPEDGCNNALLLAVAIYQNALRGNASSLKIVAELLSDNQEEEQKASNADAFIQALTDSAKAVYKDEEDKTV